MFSVLCHYNYTTLLLLSVLLLSVLLLSVLLSCGCKKRDPITIAKSSLHVDCDVD